MNVKEEISGFENVVNSIELEFRQDLAIHLFSTMLLHRINPKFPPKTWSQWPLREAPDPRLNLIYVDEEKPDKGEGVLLGEDIVAEDPEPTMESFGRALKRRRVVEGEGEDEGEYGDGSREGSNGHREYGDGYREDGNENDIENGNHFSNDISKSHDNNGDNDSDSDSYDSLDEPLPEPEINDNDSESSDNNELEIDEGNNSGESDIEPDTLPLFVADNVVIKGQPTNPYSQLLLEMKALLHSKIHQKLKAKGKTMTTEFYDKAIENSSRKLCSKVDDFIVELPKHKLDCNSQGEKEKSPMTWQDMLINDVRMPGTALNTSIELHKRAYNKCESMFNRLKYGDYEFIEESEGSDVGSGSDGGSDLEPGNSDLEPENSDQEPSSKSQTTFDFDKYLKRYTDLYVSSKKVAQLKEILDSLKEKDIDNDKKKLLFEKYLQHKARMQFLSWNKGPSSQFMKKDEPDYIVRHGGIKLDSEEFQTMFDY